MHINYEYQLNWARENTAENRRAAILDYGCGSGEVVIAGRNEGIHIYGADIYQAGGSSLENAASSGLLGSAIRRIDHGRLDFPDDYFDLVMSNQVMEHVDPIDIVLEEIHRVMKPGGKFLSVFPVLETIPEKHIGIPCAHWFARKNPLRYSYVHLMRILGFGAYKGDLPARQWTSNQLDWLDRFTHYRARDEIMTEFKSLFEVTCYEEDYIRFRWARVSSLLDRGIFATVTGKKVLSRLFHRLAGMVILCVK